MQLSNQALAAVMFCLQNALATQSDIVPMLQALDLEETEHGLVVTNPPVVHADSLAQDWDGDDDDVSRQLELFTEA